MSGRPQALRRELAPARSASVIVACCTGAMRLSQEIGLPLVHVDAVEEPGAAFRLLNEVEHGSGFRTLRESPPVLWESGWSDWAALRLDPPSAPQAGLLGSCVRAEGGMLAVDLPRTGNGTLLEFRSQLRAALRHLRLQEVTQSARYLTDRSRARRGHLVQPRYTATTATREVSLVDDLYVIDPLEHAWRLYWIVASAWLATADRRGPSWW